MFVIPSRSRPHNIARLLEAFKATGAEAPVRLRLDFDDPILSAYSVLPFPDNWDIHIGPRNGLADAYNEAPRDWDWYGIFADDIVPLVEGWDRALIEAAKPDRMAYSGGPEHFVLGGDLVRDVGFVALPGLKRIYIDTVWKEIALERGVLTPLSFTAIEHRHFSNGKAMFDSTYRKPDKAYDRALYQAWKNRKESL